MRSQRQLVFHGLLLILLGGLINCGLSLFRRDHFSHPLFKIIFQLSSCIVPLLLIFLLLLASWRGLQREQLNAPN